MRLVVVDGFCGGGIYQDEAGLTHPGSPLILREALQCGRARLHTRRAEMGMRRPFDFGATLYLNDIDPDATALLKTQLEGTSQGGWEPDTRISTLPFEQLAREIIEHYRGRRGSPRILFVLDQYGLSDATLPVMRELFAAFPKAEIMLTFAIDALANFASPNMRERYEKMLAKMGFDEVVSADRLTQLKAEDDGAKHLIQTVILREVFPQTAQRLPRHFSSFPSRAVAATGSCIWPTACGPTTR
jgi:three-Cys-motif partner protein